MNLGIIIVVLLLCITFLPIVLFSYVRFFDKKHSISKGAYVPVSIGGMLFNLIRKHQTEISWSSIMAQIFIVGVGILIIIAHIVTGTFVSDYKTTVVVCSELMKSPHEEAKISARILAKSMEHKLSIYKCRDKTMFGLFDMSIPDKIYDLPDRIIYESTR